MSIIIAKRHSNFGEIIWLISKADIEALQVEIIDISHIKIPMPQEAEFFHFNNLVFEYHKVWTENEILQVLLLDQKLKKQLFKFL